MDKEEFDLLVAILKGATKQLVDMLLQRFADAAKKTWAAIRRAAQCAFAWVCNACEHAGAYLRDALKAVRAALQELIAAVQTRLATA